MNSSNNLDFSGETIYVAIDTHLKSWTVRLGLKDTTLKGFTQPPSGKTLSKHLHQNYPGAQYRCAYDIGFNGFAPYDTIVEQGLECLAVHPADIPIRDKDRAQKTDGRDSYQLLKMLRADQVEGVYVPDMMQRDGRSLVRCRCSIVKELTRVRHRIRSHLYLFGICIPDKFKNGNWSHAFIGWLNQQLMKMNAGAATLELLLEQMEFLRLLLLKVSRQVRTMSKSEKYEKRSQALISLPGIGVITAMVLLTEIVDINRFSGADKLASYCGLIPIMHNSGQTVRQNEMTYRGNKIVRKTLIESAWVAKRTDPYLALKYQKALRRTSIANKAIVVVARTLLNRIYSILKKTDSLLRQNDN